jgi:hypothetical protein
MPGEGCAHQSQGVLQGLVLCKRVDSAAAAANTAATAARNGTQLADDSHTVLGAQLPQRWLWWRGWCRQLLCLLLLLFCAVLLLLLFACPCPCCLCG